MVTLKGILGQMVYPILSLHQRDELTQHVLFPAALQSTHASDYEELGFCSRKGDVDPPPVLEQVTNIASLVAAHKAQDDDLLVTSLEPIGGVHLDAGVPAQLPLEDEQ